MTLELFLIANSAAKKDIAMSTHGKSWITDWNPEDTKYWEAKGKFIARRNLIVLTRDRRIRSRPAELRQYNELGIRSIWIGAKQDLSAQAMVDLFTPFQDELVMLAAHLVRTLRLLTFSGTHPKFTGGDLLTADQIVEAVLFGAVRREETP